MEKNKSWLGLAAGEEGKNVTITVMVFLQMAVSVTVLPGMFDLLLSPLIHRDRSTSVGFLSPIFYFRRVLRSETWHWSMLQGLYTPVSVSNERWLHSNSFLWKDGDDLDLDFVG